MRSPAKDQRPSPNSSKRWRRLLRAGAGSAFSQLNNPLASRSPSWDFRQVFRPLRLQVSSEASEFRPITPLVSDA